MNRIQPADIFPLYNESYLYREQIARGDIPKLLPHPDLYGFSKEVQREVARLTRHSQIIRYNDYTFPRVKRGYALRNPGLDIGVQQKQEAIRSLEQGSWNCVLGLVERTRTRILSG